METRHENDHSPSGQQEPVGTRAAVPEVVGHALALPVAGRIEVLERLCALSLPRLEEAGELIDELHSVRGEARTAGFSSQAEEAKSADEVVEEALRQAMGAQVHLFRMLASRTLAELSPPERERLIERLDGIVKLAPAGETLPASH
jgi:hypothetical protein